jgi:hypothetical protein
MVSVNQFRTRGGLNRGSWYLTWPLVRLTVDRQHAVLAVPMMSCPSYERDSVSYVGYDRGWRSRGLYFQGLNAAVLPQYRFLSWSPSELLDQFDALGWPIAR